MTETWIPNVNLPEDVAKIPAGRIVENGKVLYVDGNGDRLTGEQYEKLHGVDPEPLWENIQKYRAEGKPSVRIGGK